MSEQIQQPMAIIIRTDKLANVVQSHFQNNFQSANDNLSCKLDGHRLTFKSAYLPESIIRFELNYLAKQYPELFKVEIMVEYDSIDMHERDYQFNF